jgi:hypothetical protein
MAVRLEKGVDGAMKMFSSSLLRVISRFLHRAHPPNGR